MEVRSFSSVLDDVFADFKARAAAPYVRKDLGDRI